MVTCQCRSWFQSSSDAWIFLPAEVFQRDQSNQRVKFIFFKVCDAKVHYASTWLNFGGVLIQSA